MQATAIEAFLGLSGQLVWLALLHATWLGLLAAAIVAIAFEARPRRSHRARHDASLVALIVVVLGAPAVAIFQQAVSPRREDETAVSSIQQVWFIAEDQPALAGAIPRQQVDTSSRPQLLEASSMVERAADAAKMAGPFVLACWTVCVLSLAILLAIAMASTRRLRRSSRPADAQVLASMTRLCRLLRLGSPPLVRVHPRISEPCLCGVIRPVILVPRRWLATAAPEAIDAVLAHELAHARRADHVVNLCQRLVEMLLFFHPAIRWLSRSLRRHREFCTDALAVRLTGNPLALARAMESIARLRPVRPTVRPFGASLGCEGSSLYPRIQELIGMMPARPRRRLWPF
uniref:M56 family metallopeptidase n=1 Tax=Aquisphaera insulae TaxID=2712864 RepID=UPI0013EA1A45